jgi:hypothetical protein
LKQKLSLGPKDAASNHAGWRSEAVGFGSGQGLSVFETAGILAYSEDLKKAKTRPWAKRCRF